MMQGLFKIAISLGLLFFIAGCESLSVPKGHASTGAIDFNLAFEKAQNEMLLLNIVRASKRYLMYFTTMNDMRGSFSYGLASAGLTVPFGKIGSGFNGAYTLNPTASYSMNPQFSVAAQNSKEFIQGMLSPVSPETFAYFWKQGWPRELLFVLFVQSVENKAGKVVLNYPGGTGSEFTAFKKEIADFAIGNQCDIQEDKGGDDEIGPPFNEQGLGESRLKDLVEMQKAGLKLNKTSGGKWQLASAKKSTYKLVCRIGQADSKEVKTIRLANDESTRNGWAAEEMILHLRSPEGVIYYLGEITRSEARGSEFTVENDYCKGQTAENLFKVLASNTPAGKSSNSDPYVSVEYEGVNYFIPRLVVGSDADCPDRSMHVLALVSLLIAKQQSGSELPPPAAVVTTIGK